MTSARDEVVRLAGELAVPVGDPISGVRRPADGHALVADGDVGMMVLGLGEVGEAVHERDRVAEARERELALERAAVVAPAVDVHGGEYGVFERSRKRTPTRELLVDVYRPLAHLVVVALLPLRVPPPAVVLAGLVAGLASAVELARGQLVAAAALLVLKTVLDGADGALARASDRVTALGRYLDSESDLLVNAALFAALGYLTRAYALAAAAFLALTLVLSVNFNLRRLYEGAPTTPDEDTRATRAARRVYGAMYAWQDRAVEHFVAWRLRDADERGRRAYHDRASLTFLHNLGMSTQHTAIALLLVANAARIELWVPLACALTLIPLELRRGRLARLRPEREERQ
jgi:archaetidylinositol phosphate synthase